MRLLNVNTLSLEMFNGRHFPRYAILSHTWREGEEVTFEELGTESAKLKPGYAKITQSCRIAAQREFRYIWIDTCCIDKRNSAELSEAINSMFEWYRRSVVCYAYLEDVDLDGRVGRSVLLTGEYRLEPGWFPHPADFATGHSHQEYSCGCARVSDAGRACAGRSS